MGTRGPKPRAELHVLHNTNPGRARPMPWPLEAKLPPCPRHLDGHARALWRSLGPALVREGLMCELYRGMFEMLCAAWGHLLDLEQELRTLPEGSKERSGLRRLRIAQSKLVVQLAAEFGLSPNWRGRVQGDRTPPTTPSAWDQFGGKGT
jgi:phage terminase small subunit